MRDNTILFGALFKIVILGFVFFGALFEIVILGFAFFGADEVDCNLLWCEFKTTRRTIENNTIVSSNSIITHNSECYQNGIKINCSNMPDVNSIINNAMGDING